MNKIVTLLVLLAGGLAAAPVVTAAEYGRGHEPRGVHVWRQASTGLSLEQAARKVQQESGGKLLSAEERRENGGRVYRFKVLMPDGVVRFIAIDAATGASIRYRR